MFTPTKIPEIYGYSALRALSKKLNGKLGVSKHHPILKKGDKVVVLRRPIDDPSQIIELKVVTIKPKDFPELRNIGKHHPEHVVVGVETAQTLGLDIDPGGDLVAVMKKDAFNKACAEYVQEEYVYPIHIILDRYMGVYSHGKWIAWAGEYKDIPPGVFEDDVACSKEWTKLHQKRDEGKVSFGIGDSPNKALDDLKVIIQAQKIGRE